MLKKALCIPSEGQDPGTDVFVREGSRRGVEIIVASSVHEGLEVYRRFHGELDRSICGMTAPLRTPGNDTLDLESHRPGEVFYEGARGLQRNAKLVLLTADEEDAVTGAANDNYCSTMPKYIWLADGPQNILDEITGVLSSPLSKNLSFAPRDDLIRNLRSQKAASIEHSWSAYRSATDDRIKQLERASRDPDVHGDVRQAVKIESSMFYRRCWLLASRAEIQEVCDGRHSPEDRLRRRAEFLSEWGGGTDVTLLRLADRTGAFPFLGPYADRLAARLQYHDRLRPGRHYPKPVPGADALAKLWFDLYREDLLAYHGEQTVAVNWKGVVAVGAEDAVRRDVAELRRSHGDFPCYIGDPSLPDSVRAPSTSLHTDRDKQEQRTDPPPPLDRHRRDPKDRPQVEKLIIPPDALETMEPELQAKLRRTPPSGELRVLVHLRDDDEYQDAPEVGDESDPLERHHARVQRRRAWMADAYGDVLRRIDATGVQRLGGEMLTTLVLQGTPAQIVAASAVEGVERVFMDRATML